MAKRPTDTMRYDSSARRSVSFWMMLTVGVGLAWAGSTIDPADNCNSAGECAPWLIPVAKWMGICLAAAAAGQLFINPRHGSRIDPVTGHLIWWQNRTATLPGDEASIHPSQIGHIRIVRVSESADEVHLYDRQGVLQPYFDNKVIPWRQERWAQALIARWPHIILEIKE